METAVFLSGAGMPEVATEMIVALEDHISGLPPAERLQALQNISQVRSQMQTLLRQAEMEREGYISRVEVIPHRVDERISSARGQ
jgi:hypothetical protein